MRPPADDIDDGALSVLVPAPGAALLPPDIVLLLVPAGGVEVGVSVLDCDCDGDGIAALPLVGGFALELPDCAMAMPPASDRLATATPTSR